MNELANYVILFFGAFFVIIFFLGERIIKSKPKNIFKLKSKDSVINSDSLISECLNDQGFQRIVHSLKNKGIVLEKQFCWSLEIKVFSRSRGSSSVVLWGID